MCEWYCVESLQVLLSKNMGGGLCCHDPRRSTSNFLANSDFCFLFVMFVCVNAFYLRKSGENSMCPGSNLRIPPRGSANRHVYITAFYLRC